MGNVEAEEGGKNREKKKLKIGVKREKQKYVKAIGSL